MPFYWYECENCGHQTEQLCTMSKVKRKIVCEECGKKMERNFAREMGKQYIGESPTKGKPSLALAVNPEEVHQTIAEDIKMGASASGWTKDGSPYFDSDSHKRKYMKAHGYHFNNSYV